MINNVECVCINLRQATNNFIILYDKALKSHHVKITLYSTLKTIEKLVNFTIQIKSTLISYDYENSSKNKIIRLNSNVDKKLSEYHII